MKSLFLLVAIFIFHLSSGELSSLWAQCPNFSWIVEFHAKRRAVNCLSAANEFDQVIESIISALHSGRTVDIKEFGKFTLKSNKGSNKLGISKNKLTRVRFESSAQLTERINEPIEHLNSNKELKLK